MRTGAKRALAGNPSSSSLSFPPVSPSPGALSARGRGLHVRFSDIALYGHCPFDQSREPARVLGSGLTSRGGRCVCSAWPARSQDVSLWVRPTLDRH